MKSVLCYGDSNTHGYIPGGTAYERFGPHERWPGVLRQKLGSKWYVIEDGLGGRTTVHDDVIEGAYKNGRTYLRPCLLAHAPLDLIIIMLGTNDLKTRFNQVPSEISMGMACLIHDIREIAPGPLATQPEVMIVAPPPIQDELGDWEDAFLGGVEKSHQLSLKFETMADSMGVHFFDAASVCETDPKDGFHINKDAHQALGTALAIEVESIGWLDDED